MNSCLANLEHGTMEAQSLLRAVVGSANLQLCGKNRPSILPCPLVASGAVLASTGACFSISRFNVLSLQGVQ